MRHHGRQSESRSIRARWLTSVALAFASAAATAVMWAVGWLPAVDRVSGDLLLRAVPRPAQDAPVAAVLIDDLSVERHGPLPWPRSRLGRLIEAVDEAGARAIAIDIVLADSTRADEDARLGSALAEMPSVLAAAFDSAGGWLLPLDRFGGAITAAHAYGEVGPDGVIRSFATTKQSRDLALPSLSLAAARLLRPGIEIAPGTLYRPQFRPAPQDIVSTSAADLLGGLPPAAEIAGRLVFLGISATGAGDQFVVPTGPAHTPVPGVLAHASAAASLLEGRLMRVPGVVWSLTTSLALAFGVQLLRDRRGAFDLARFLALVGGIFLLAAVAAAFSLVLLPVAALTAAMVASALLREAVESRVAHRDAGRLLESMLAHADTASTPVPTSARGRLTALESLQRRVLTEDATRRALLTGMREGVVLWDRNGQVLEANPSAERLWGDIPSLREIRNLEPPDGRTARTATRSRRDLAVDLAELDFGCLAIIRDVSAEAQLERRRREMQRLVSHELKTPLASIAGFGESIERYNLSPEELRRVAALIRGEAARLQEMVVAFLDLERLGGGHWDGEIEDLDLGLLVQSRLAVLAAAAGQRQVEISAEISPGCKVPGVASLIERVVDNLVGNAIKYSHPGARIFVSVREVEEGVLLSVRDTGQGIPDEALAKIFDRFYRVPGSRGSGAGLGLALVKEVVDWHGGCITIETTPGDGSTFTVRLPGAEEA